MQDQLTAAMVSKGKATDMISKIKFGAKGWFNEMEADKKRRAREADGMKQREQVQVGPLAGPQPRERKSSASASIGGLNKRLAK